MKNLGIVTLLLLLLSFVSNQLASSCSQKNMLLLFESEQIVKLFKIFSWMSYLALILFLVSFLIFTSFSIIKGFKRK